MIQVLVGVPLLAKAYRASSLYHRGGIFSVDLTLPPLQSRGPDSKHQFELAGKIPALYTNDPVAVATWLENNVPSNGCMIGFDVEVSREQTFG